MALFDAKKNKEAKKTEALTKAVPFVIEPHIAEKSTALQAKGVYVFKIGKKTNKVMVRQAVKEKYGVLPQKVNIINLPHKTVTFRGRKGTRSGFKKAVVYLKKGDKIEIS